MIYFFLINWEEKKWLYFSFLLLSDWNEWVHTISNIMLNVMLNLMRNSQWYTNFVEDQIGMIWWLHFLWRSSSLWWCDKLRSQSQRVSSLWQGRMLSSESTFVSYQRKVSVDLYRLFCTSPCLPQRLSLILSQGILFTDWQFIVTIYGDLNNC
jgi:hypothetical protein